MKAWEVENGRRGEGVGEDAGQVLKNFFRTLPPDEYFAIYKNTKKANQFAKKICRLQNFLKTFAWAEKETSSPSPPCI